ncbi:hypothetical protein [Candidatus Pyrohabitans sp.]
MELTSLLDFIERRGMSVNVLLGEERIFELKPKAGKSFEVVIHNPEALKRFLQEFV